MRFFVSESFLRLRTCFIERVRTGRLVSQLVSGCDIVTNDAAQLFLDRCGIVRCVDNPWFLGSLFSQIDDRADNLAALFMREHHCAEHFFLGQFLRFGFNHHHSILCCCNDQVQTAFVVERSLQARVEFVFAIAETDARCTDRAHEWNARDGQCGRSCDHRNNVRFGFAIIGQNLSDNIDFVVETFREKRANRAVDQTAGQRFFFRCAAFALEEATRDTAGCREFFLIVNSEREEVLPFTNTFCGGYSAEHYGFAIGGQNGAVCLTGNLTGFESEGFSAPFNRHGFLIKHVFSF